MIYIVSGLPRTGTSMMMRILHTGGMHALTDNIREADSDNPNGYFELEKVKKIKEDASWIDEAEGKVFKMVSMLLLDLPTDRDYKIIFMRRNIDEILASQARMLQNMGNAQPQPPDEKMGELFALHLQQVDRYLEGQPRMQVLHCPHREVIQSPHEQARRIADFLDLDLDVAAMAGVVDMPHGEGAQADQQWIAIAIVWYAQGPQQLDFQAGLLMDFRKTEVQHVVFEIQHVIRL